MNFPGQLTIAENLPTQSTTKNYLMYHPGDLDILFSLAGILYKTDAYDEACDVMERLMALSPEYQGGKELMERISLASVQVAR